MSRFHSVLVFMGAFCRQAGTFFCQHEPATASHWPNKRDGYLGNGDDSPCDNTGECWRMYEPIEIVMREPNFKKLLGHDGEMNLNCSMAALSEARDCRGEMSACPRDFTKRELFIAWDTFCENKEEVENTSDCWEGDELPLAISVCYDMMDRNPLISLPDCIGNEVSMLPVCGDKVGHMLRDVILNMFEVHHSGTNGIGE